MHTNVQTDKPKDTTDMHTDSQKSGVYIHGGPQSEPTYFQAPAFKLDFTKNYPN